MPMTLEDYRNGAGYTGVTRVSVVDIHGYLCTPLRLNSVAIEGILVSVRSKRWNEADVTRVCV